MLDNAIKFTECGKVTLKVSVIANFPLKSEDSVAQPIRFEIKDTGVGIAADEIEKIFQPFEQVGDREKQKGGIGLGLAISQQIIQLMGSQLKVTSQLKEGSTFWFDATFPVKAVVRRTQPSRSTKPVASPENGTSKRRILVVDDVANNRLLLSDLLESVGFEVLLAEDGEEGIEVACKTQPDGILTDVYMGVKTGWSMVRKLRQIPSFSGIPIIAIAAGDPDTIGEMMKKAGCNDFLHKPIDENKLFALLEKYFPA